MTTPDPAAQPAPQPAPKPAEQPALARILSVIGPIVSIGTALLFYFGWVRTASQSAQMGLDDGLFGMSTRDYALRSLPALYLPLLATAAVLLLWLTCHVAIVQRLEEGRDVERIRRISSWTARLAWLVVPAIGLLGAAVSSDLAAVTFPLGLALGALLSEWGARVRATVDRALGLPDTRPAWAPGVRWGLVGVLVTAALFWGVASYAGIIGRGYAAGVEEDIDKRPSATVYAAHGLGLSGNGVTRTDLGAGEAFRYRYTGLRLLQVSGGMTFLVPDGWRPGAAPLIVLGDRDDVRMEFSGVPRREL